MVPHTASRATPRPRRSPHSRGMVRLVGCGCHRGPHGRCALQTVVIHWLISTLHERRTLTLSLGVMVLSDVGLGFARELWQGYIVQVCAVFGLLAFPAVSAIKANMVADSEQGKLQVGATSRQLSAPRCA